MGDGLVLAIYVGARKGAPLEPVEEVRAVAGRGLEGDRYFAGEGTFSDRPGSGRDVTLIEAEAVEALAREEGIELGWGDPRRNIVTRGVALNHLVDREFRVGETVLRGMRLCEPCAHLSGLTGHGLVQPLLHRAGLRADIVSGGTIRAGDVLEDAPGGSR